MEAIMPILGALIFGRQFEPFFDLLVDFSEFCGFKQDSQESKCLNCTGLSILNSRLDQELQLEVLVALSGIICALSVWKINLLRHEQIDPQLHAQAIKDFEQNYRELAVSVSAQWLAKRIGRRWWHFKSPKPGRRKLRKLLEQLCDDYAPYVFCPILKN